MSARPPTIREVAARAGVSVGTVSHVLTGKRPVGAQTAARVERAIAELGFRPDHAARSLIGRRGRGGPVVPEGAPRLTAVGYVSVDYTARVDVLPHRGDRARAHSIEKTLGGPAANVAVMAGGLGAPFAVRAEVLGHFGDDADSDWAINLLAERRVAAVPVATRSGERLGRTVVLVEASGARTILYEPLAIPPAALRHHLAGLPRPTVRHALHIQGHHAPDLLEGVSKARELGLATSIHLTGLPEPWHRPEPVSKLFAAFDFVVMNRETAALVTGVRGPTKALVEALARCSESLAGCLVLTLDHEGAVLLRDRRQALRIAAPAVQPVDTTGAGDCLVGVFLAAWLNGAAEETALGHAVHAASRSVTVAGAQEMTLSAAALLGPDLAA